MTLDRLLDGIAAAPAGAPVRVLDMTLDSREVRSGSLFFALSGLRSHGLQFAADAAARGASIVLWDPATGEQPPLVSAPEGRGAPPFVPVRGLQGLVGRIADRFFGEPSAHLRVVGITGTNGKTTCAYLLTQCLERLRREAAYIGTIGWGRIGALLEPTHTTPDVVGVHRRLATLRAAGVLDVAMEVSSHALDQGRVDAVRFHSAAFTNLTRDHLDYHSTMQAYGTAKARLFAAPALQHAVINVGDPFGRELAAQRGSLPGVQPEVLPGAAGLAALTAVWVDGAGAMQCSAGAAPPWAANPPPMAQSLYATEVALDLGGVSMTVAGSFGRCRVSTRLLGRFNAENCVVVLACLASLGIPLVDAAAALAECDAPPGRMEVVAAPDGGRPLAVIDYAHTPDALAKALQTLREHCRGALWCVFGCGGDRDPGKRPLMGAIVDQLADQIIVTDDNPRSEAPEAIVQAILTGITVHAARVIHDRSQAIETALNEAGAVDMVLIAGKGHEDYQIYGDVRRRFSDRHEAQRHLGAAA